MKRIEEKVGNLLRTLGATISLAESCTGGLIAHRITNVSGSSDYFDSCIVAYHNQAKVKLLGVPQSLINQHGAVSKPVARAMAEGVRRIRNTTIGLATTGVAGPSGGTPEAPVGTVFVAISGPDGTIVRRFLHPGKRIEIKRFATQEALKMILEYPEGDESKG